MKHFIFKNEKKTTVWLMLKSCGKTQVLCVKCAKNTEHWHERSIRWVDKTYVLVLLFAIWLFWGGSNECAVKTLKIVCHFGGECLQIKLASCLHISTKKIPYGTWKLRTKNHTSTCTVNSARLTFGIRRAFTNKNK